MANKLTIKDPNCLHVQIIPWLNPNITAAINFGGSAINVAPNALDASRAITLQGVFAEDGAFATLESTKDDDDEFTETADGSVCVYTTSRRNEILTLRLNSCNGYLESLINLKNRRISAGGARAVAPVPLYIRVCDFCTGFNLTSSCAWMISNPSVSFGNDDSPIELKFLLTETKNRMTNSTDVFDNFSGVLIDTEEDLVSNAVGNVFGN